MRSDRYSRCASMNSAARASASRKAWFGTIPCVGREAKVLEHVEGRVERAVTRARTATKLAVPPAVLELCTQHRRAKWRKPRILGQEMRAEPEPEAEVAEIHALEQERAVDARSGRHEPPEQALDRRTSGGMAFGAERGEQQRRPGSVRPTPFRPLAVGSPKPEELSHPAALDHSSSFLLPCLGRLVEQVAHHLPEDRRVAFEQPVDHRLFARHLNRARYAPYDLRYRQQRCAVAQPGFTDHIAVR